MKTTCDIDLQQAPVFETNINPKYAKEDSIYSLLNFLEFLHIKSASHQIIRAKHIDDFCERLNVPIEPC